MRIFKNYEEAQSEITRDLVEMGTEIKVGRMQDKDVAGNDDYDTKEILNYQYTLLSDKGLDEALEKRGLTKWAEADFKERISPLWVNPGHAWKGRQEVWEEFLKKNNGKFAYTYNERLRTQVPQIIELLKKHPNSRQAVISIWNPTIDVEKVGIDRVPCSLSYQLLIRDGKLNIIYTMRSMDWFTHAIVDIWQACRLRDYILAELNRFRPENDQLKKGSLIHCIASLHVYKKDYRNLGVF